MCKIVTWGDDIFIICSFVPSKISIGSFSAKTALAPLSRQGIINKGRYYFIDYFINNKDG
jgi:hypothetical protein